MSVSDEFDVTIGTYREGRNDLSRRMSDGWRDMRQSTRRLMAEAPSEARLLFYVLMSDMIFFLSWSIKTLVSPIGGAGAALPREVGFWLIIAMLFRTSALYVASVFVGSLVRIMGGAGTWKDTRTAVFWGALVAAPVGLAIAVLTAGLVSSYGVFPWGETALGHAVLYSLSLVPFVWFISVGVSAAHEIRSGLGTTLIMVAVAGLSVLALYVLMAHGLI